MEIELADDGPSLAGKGFVDAAGAAAPAFGMVGTLIGLIVLQNLDDPSAWARYGRGPDHHLLRRRHRQPRLHPLAGKLGQREEVLTRQVMVEGVLAIQASEIPT